MARQRDTEIKMNEAPQPEQQPPAKPRRWTRAAIVADLIQHGFDEKLASRAVDCWLTLLMNEPNILGKMSFSKDDKSMANYCFFQGFMAGFICHAHWN